MSTVSFFYGIVHQGHNTAKSQCHRQGSIPNRWDVIKLEVRLVFPYMQCHRAQANFSEHTMTGKGIKLLYISYIVIPDESICFFLTMFGYTVFD